MGRVRIITAVCALSMVLAGCGQPAVLPHEEVLERAGLASQLLQSANFILDINGTYKSDVLPETIVAHVKAHGGFAQGGNVLSSDFDASFQWTGKENETASFEVGGTVSTFDQNETFVFIRNIQKGKEESGSPFDKFSMFVGRWLQFSSAQNTQSDVQLTPDPRVIKAQVALMDVVEDLGMESYGEGYAYHYKVRLDPEKFAAYARDNEGVLSAEGEVWIDAKTFYLLSAKWVLDNIPMKEGKVAAILSVIFADHDADSEFAAPTPVDPVVLPPDFFNEEDGAQTEENSVTL